MSAVPVLQGTYTIPDKTIKIYTAQPDGVSCDFDLVKPSGYRLQACSCDGDCSDDHTAYVSGDNIYFKCSNKSCVKKIGIIISKTN